MNDDQRLRFAIAIGVFLFVGVGAGALLTRAHAPEAQAAQLSMPAVKEHRFEDGKMLVIQVPVTSLKNATEHQTCFVWRGAGADSLSCPNDRQTYSVDPPTR